jgi:hypothetical protein
MDRLPTSSLVSLSNKFRYDRGAEQASDPKPSHRCFEIPRERDGFKGPMKRHGPHELLLAPFETEAVFFKFASQFPGGEHAVGSGVAFDLSLYEEEQRRQDINAHPHRIVDYDRVL